MAETKLLIAEYNFVEVFERGSVYTVELKTGKVLEVCNDREDALDIADDFERRMVD